MFKQQDLCLQENNMNLGKIFKFSFRLDNEIKMQSRSLRLKNFGWLCIYMSWYVGVSIIK